MYFSSVGGNFIKAQVQNHYENVRRDLFIRDIAKRHIHSVSNINKSIREAKDTLRDIRASSGYCKEERRNETAPASSAWKEREWSRRTSQPNDSGRSEIQAIRKTSLKNLDSGERPTVSRTSIDGFSPRSLIPRKNELRPMENSMHGKNGTEVNGDRSDIVPDGRLLRDEILMMPDSRNVSGRVIKGTSRQGMDPAVSAKKSGVKEPQGKSLLKSTSSANGGNFQITDTTSSTDTGKRLGSLASRTDEPPESVTGSSKLRPNTSTDGLVGYRSQTAPEKASRIIISPLKSARTSRRELKENSGCMSTSEEKKVKIHLSISRTERKRLLQELISSCAAPCDRSVLERQRQRRLQEKIDRFFEMLFEQEDECDKDDGSDISSDD